MRSEGDLIIRFLVVVLVLITAWSDDFIDPSVSLSLPPFPSDFRVLVLCCVPPYGFTEDLGAVNLFFTLVSYGFCEAPVVVW